MKIIPTLLLLLSFHCNFGQSEVVVLNSEQTRILDIPTQYINANGKALVTAEYLDNLKNNSARSVDPMEIEGWPVAGITGTAQRASRVIDIDLDGTNEIIFNTGNTVRVFTPDGLPKTGWPSTVGADPLEGAPVVGNIDSDPELEIVVHTTFFGIRGGLYAFDHDGSLMPGFPILWPDGGPQKEPLLENIDSDPELEIISHVNNFPTSFVYAYNGDGSLDPDWSNINLDYIPGSGCSSGDITGDGIPEIIACTYWKLYAFDLDGQLLSGFPFTFEQDVRGVSYSNPVLADIDEDGVNEICVATVNEAPVTDAGAVYVLNGDGTLLNGWPQYIFYWPFAPVSVADFNGDDHLEILVGDQVLSPDPENRVNAWDRNGNPLSGFPIVNLPAINVQGSIGDLDANGDLEIILDNNITSQPFQLFNHDGTDFTGFTLNPSGATFFNTALLADVNQDGNLNIVASTVDLNLFTTDMHIYDPEVVFDLDLNPLATHQYNSRNTGEYGTQDILAVPETSTDFTGLKIYPNPFDEWIRIQSCENRESEITLELFDVSGRRVFSSSESRICEWRIPNSLTPGMYLYKIESGGKISSGKLIRK